MTEFVHQSVLLPEVIEALRPRDGGRYFDGCCGGAGHSAAILGASAPTGYLYACDQDGDAVATANERLAPFAGRFEIQRRNFSELADWIPSARCDGALLDLGVSSHQLEVGPRGFSFQVDGPLDMRMDRRQGLTAADLVNGLSERELATLFWELGEERDSRRIARAVVRERDMRPIESTRQLADAVERVCPRNGRRIHPASRVFQALRMRTNDELGALQRGLRSATDILAPGGRLAIITFHSLEDRMVREFMRAECRDYDLVEGADADLPHYRVPRPARASLVTRKAILPSESEIRKNPRARSAQLRVLETL